MNVWNSGVDSRLSRCGVSMVVVAIALLTACSSGGRRFASDAGDTVQGVADVWDSIARMFKTEPRESQTVLPADESSGF